MAIIKCKMCGGDLTLLEGQSVAECEYCGTHQTVPAADNEKKLALFNRAHRLRHLSEFDKAAGVYEQIVAQFPEEAEAYWGLVLCDYGIEYVDDPNSGKKVPTCHRSSYNSVLDNKDFSLAMEYADVTARRIYRQEAKQIEQLRKDIVAVSSQEAPYDIFICYKETDDSGNRTLDSVLAQDIYNMLTEKGNRVFFSRVSLEDKLGQEYEPYIFAALNSARIMLVVGTDYERFHAVWVKNEWSRFLKLMEQDKTKHLIPCFRDIDAYDMPSEFTRLQSQDLGKVGAMQDLLRGIEKLMPRKKTVTVIQERIQTHEQANTAPLLRRVALFLEDRDWESADKYCEKVLDIDPENGDAYFGKLMAEYRISRETELEKMDPACLNSANYLKALRFGDGALQEKLENIRKDTVYHTAKKTAAQKGSREQQKSNYREAISQLQTIPSWRDSDQLAETYQSQIRRMEEQEEAQRLEQQRKKQRKREKLESIRRKQTDKQNPVQGEQKHSMLKKLLVVILCAVILLEICIFAGLMPRLFKKKTDKTQTEQSQTSENSWFPEKPKQETQRDDAELSPEEIQYRQAEFWETDGQLGRAAIAFGKLGDYSDARERSFSVWQKITPRTTWGSMGGGSYAIKNDGTVACSADNLNTAVVSQWQDLVEIVGNVGLRSDGTLVTNGRVRPKSFSVAEWTEVVDILAGTCRYGVRPTTDGWHAYLQNYMLGLRSDGTVIATGDNNWGQCDVSGWTDIIAIATDTYQLENEPVKYPIDTKFYGFDEAESYNHYYSVGLKSDGSVVTAGEIPANWDLSNWTDIVKITTSGDHMAGLKSDGTVVSTYYDRSELSDWNSVTDIDAGPYHLIGLKSDGTVAAVGNNYTYKHLNVEDWTDIVAISASSRHTVGLKSDGTVVAVGSNRVDSNFYGMCEVSDWTDIVAVDAYDTHTIGLKSDGTLIRTNGSSVGNTDIKIPEKLLPARNGNKTKTEEAPIDQQVQ